MVYSQEEPLDGNYEIGVMNHTDYDIEVQLHPVSSVFRVFSEDGVDPGYYTFTARGRSHSNPPNFYDYINGIHYIFDQFLNEYVKISKNIIDKTNNHNYNGWNDDFHSDGFDGNAYGTFGYGNYKIIIKTLSPNPKVDSCIIMLDYYAGILPPRTPGDIYFDIYLDKDETVLFYEFHRNSPPVNESHEINYNNPEGYTIRSWAPNGLNNPLNRRPKNYGPEGGFELIDLPQTYNPDYFPFDSRKDCIAFPSLNYLWDQNQDFPEQVPNEVRFDERHGIIPLNLTIKKKIVTPVYQTTDYPANLLISIEPSVIFTVDKCPAPNPINSGFFLNPYQNTSNGNDLVLKSSISLVPDSLTSLILTSGNNYNENSRIWVRNNCKIIAQNRSKIVLGDYSQILLDRLENQTTQIHSKLLLENNSNLIFGTNSEINVNAYGEFVNEGGNISYAQNSNAKIVIQSNGLYEIGANLTNTHTVTNGGRILLQGGQLKIGDNSSLVFDGSSSFLQINAGSTISLGQNARIEFKNGAYCISNEASISSLNSSTPGKGFIFENAGSQTSITNCVFNYLTNPIYICNSTNYYAGIFRNISGNTFYGNSLSNYMIETKNVNNITISQNSIHMAANVGIGCLIRYATISGNDITPAPPYNVNIINNSFENGKISSAFTGLANTFAGINFSYNNCYGTVSNSNIFTRQISVDIRNNSLSSVSGTTLEFNQSNPNVYANTMYSSGMNVYNFMSYPKFAPVYNNSTDAGWDWIGGRNSITSSGDNNIFYNNGNILIDWGENCINKSSGYKHLFGQIDEPSLLYYARYNNFNNSSEPDYDLHDINTGNNVNVYTISGSNYNCNNTSNTGTIRQIRDLGNGISDTIYKTSDNPGSQQNPDEVLYSIAVSYLNNNDKFQAISYFKSLITGFPESSYTDGCLYDLYQCYQSLDTSGNPGTRDILYTDLKNYLDGRILTGQYSDNFNSTAYNITLMCLTSIVNYNSAMSGYEFIALYHPDVYTRLLASWDYAEIQALINGSGGVSSKEEDLTNAEYAKLLSNRVNKSINEDPIKKKVKKSFDKVKSEKITKTEKDAFSKTKDDKSAKLEVAKMKQKDEMMNTKVTSVMRYSKTLKKEDREKMQIEDILFSRKTESKEDVKTDSKVPVVYSLSQNYPNPFNPTTKINFALPKQGFVTLKIYDITGREIKTLVNEVKQAGNYTVDFNGSYLASGVYFYKIQSGDFVSVKRMVLIK